MTTYEIIKDLCKLIIESEIDETQIPKNKWDTIDQEYVSIWEPGRITYYNKFAVDRLIRIWMYNYKCFQLDDKRCSNKNDGDLLESLIRFARRVNKYGNAFIDYSRYLCTVDCKQVVSKYTVSIVNKNKDRFFANAFYLPEFELLDKHAIELYKNPITYVRNEKLLGVHKCPFYKSVFIDLIKKFPTACGISDHIITNKCKSLKKMTPAKYYTFGGMCTLRKKLDSVTKNSLRQHVNSIVEVDTLSFQ